MKNKISLFGIALLLTSSSLFGQDTLQLAFDRSVEGHFNASYPGMAITNTRAFKGIPEAMDVQVYLQNLQRSQSSVTNYQKGYFSEEDFDKLMKAYKLDTAGLYRGNDINNSLPIVSALYPGNRKVIIADLNFNNDFSDDKVFEYKVTDFDAHYPDDSLEAMKVVYDYFYEGKAHEMHLSLKLVPTSQGYGSKNPRDKQLLVVAQLNQWRGSRFKLEGKEYEIALDHPYEVNANYTQNCNLMVRDVASNKQILFDPSFKSGGFFPLGDKMVKVENISYFGDSARLVIK
jgi:hypothetical protein